MNINTTDDFDSWQFVETILRRHFDDKFVKFGRYQYMFESSSHRVYFQNFNKPTNKLWYRLKKNARQELISTHKKALLCLTHPLGKYAYIIPMANIEEKANQHGLINGDIEINISPLPPSVETRWHELDWNIDFYHHEF